MRQQPGGWVIRSGIASRMTNSFIEGLLKVPEHISDFRLANRPSARPSHFFVFFSSSSHLLVIVVSSSAILESSVARYESSKLAAEKRREKERQDLVPSDVADHDDPSRFFLSHSISFHRLLVQRVVWLSKDIAALVEASSRRYWPSYVLVPHFTRNVRGFRHVATVSRNAIRVIGWT